MKRWTMFCQRLALLNGRMVSTLPWWAASLSNGVREWSKLQPVVVSREFLIRLHMIECEKLRQDPQNWFMSAVIDLDYWEVGSDSVMDVIRDRNLNAMHAMMNRIEDALWQPVAAGGAT